MGTPDLSNPWEEGNSLASDWNADNAKVLYTPAVGESGAQPGEQCGLKTVQLPSPGTGSNYVVLKSGSKVAEGIIHITNVGKCKVFIHGMKANGKVLDETNALELDPGDKTFQFIPPPKSTKIVGVTSSDCSDYSAIEYDLCAGIA